MTKKKNRQTVEAFVASVRELSYKTKPNFKSIPLRDITFWAGAGFSKSWDHRCPTAAELFSIPADKVADDVFSFEILERLFGISTFRTTLDLKTFQQIVYMLDMNERHPDIRSRYFDRYNIAEYRKRLRALVAAQFERLAPPTYFDEETEKLTMASATTQQKAILTFFHALDLQTDGSSGSAEGLRYHFITTNYDFVIETILDNNVSEDDSHILYTYRGVTPLNIPGFKPGVQNHGHYLVHQLLKLNGGFEILAERDGYIFDYRRRDANARRAHPPNIILPSREQIYTDPYFQEIFAKSIRLLRDSRVLVLVGYSLPEEDALLRFIIRQFAEEREDGFAKQIIYIDLMAEEEMKRRIESVFPTARHSSMAVHAFEGTFDAFARSSVNLMKKQDLI